MKNPSPYEEEKKAIAHFAAIFLKQNFGFWSRAIKVLMDSHLVVIRVEDFLSPAEIEIGMEKGNTKLIHEMYSKLFHSVKSPLVDQIAEITSKKVISSQISINTETKVFMMTFFLASNLISAGNNSVV